MLLCKSLALKEVTAKVIQFCLRICLLIFLPANFIAPITCPQLATCPTGSVAPNNILRIIIQLAVVLGALAVAFAWHTCLINAEKKDQKKDNDELKEPINIDSITDFRNLFIEFRGLGLLLDSGTRVLNGVNGYLKDSSLVSSSGLFNMCLNPPIDCDYGALWMW
jgi:hypothetical protein